MQTQPQPVRHRSESHRLVRSDQPATTGESDPSVTLPRTSPPAIVWYQQAPIIQSDPAIGVTDTSASRAWVHVGQPAPKTALKASHKALYRPEECLGSHGARPRQRGLVTNRHKSSCHVTILRFSRAFDEPPLCVFRHKNHRSPLSAPLTRQWITDKSPRVPRPPHCLPRAGSSGFAPAIR